MDDLRAGVRWSLRNALAEAEGPPRIALPSLRGTAITVTQDLTRVTLQTRPLGMRHLAAQLPALARARSATMRRLPPGILDSETLTLALRPGSTVDSATLIAVAERLAPSLLLLLGTGGGRPLVLECGAAALHLELPRPLDEVALRALPIVVALTRALLRCAATLPDSLVRHPQLIDAGGDRVTIAQRGADGGRRLRRGRLARVLGTSADGETWMYAQQSLSLLALWAEQDLREALAGDTEDVLRRIEGRSPLLTGELAPATAPAQPVVVLIDRNPQARSQARQMAVELGRRDDVRVLLTPWYQLDLPDDGGVVVSGPSLEAGGGTLQRVDLEHLVSVDVLLYDAFDAASSKGGPESSERDALMRLRRFQFDDDARRRPLLLDDLLLEATRRGVVTNAIGAQRRWGPKHQLEMTLREWTRHSGRRVPRPQTVIATGPQIDTVVQAFTQQRRDCIVKPVFGSGGADVRVIRSGEPPAAWVSGDTAVVQELVEEPLLVEGHKVDLRCHIAIDLEQRERSGRIGPPFVRRAAEPYVRGAEGAEITNTTYRSRAGLPPDMRPLDDVAGIPAADRAALIEAVDELVSLLLQAHLWWVDAARDGDAPRGGRRVLLWGADLLVSRRDGVLAVHLAENNLHPQLFNGSDACDPAMAAMLRDEYLPLLLAHGTATTLSSAIGSPADDAAAAAAETATRSAAAMG